MGWQSPGGDPPPDPEAPTQSTPAPPPPEPSTADVPAAPVAPGAPAPPVAPAAGLTPAAPVGWVGPDQQASSGAAAGGPEVAWAPPAPTAAATPVGEGLVIAGVFSRVVAYVIDLGFLGTLNLIVAGIVGTFRDDASTGLVVGVGVLFLVIDALYFVVLWRSGWHATIGMRLIGIRVLRAVDGGTLSLNDAVVRWFAVSGVVSLATLVPAAGRFLGVLALGWVVVLLVTTASNPLRQGMHDRWAGSVVVQPAPGGSGAAVVGCIILVALAFVLPFLVLIMLGNQIQNILSTVGSSI